MAFTVLLVLSTMALPLAKVKVRREKERRLREALYEMRKAIDRYKDAADKGLLGQVDQDGHGYPESLEVLVEGVEVQPGAGGGMPGQMPPGMGGPMGGQMGGQMGGRMGGRGQGGFGQQQGGMGGIGGGMGGAGGGMGGGFGSRQQQRGGSRQGGFGSRRERDGADGDDEPGKLRFLRRIPVDPMTGRAEWGMRSVSDSPDSMSWSGKNVFDVYSLSHDTALDGSRYSEW